MYLIVFHFYKVVHETDVFNVHSCIKNIHRILRNQYKSFRTFRNDVLYEAINK